MANLLITGATGNVGMEVIRSLLEIGEKDNIIAGSHNIDTAKQNLKNLNPLSFRKVDFSDPGCFESALKNIDVVFLLRPPQLADIPKYFAPFLQEMKKQGIDNIVFLSVQGVEKQAKIPHHKLEKLIESYGFNHVFLRPSYFMQNLTTTLLFDIINSKRIFIPAGKAMFCWVDVRDIGKVAARVMIDFESFKNQHLEITGSEILNFNEVASIMTEVLARPIRYVSPNLCHFFLHKKKQGAPSPMIFVMIMLHFLPRFQKQNHNITNVVKEISGENPGLLKDFILRNKEIFN